ncbi:coiled-coil domain-containing protein 134-like [Schistosoma japonicum]|nr:coiled-coil domain-containing protein 134-like [Schistosoma japonicum]
MKQMNLHYFNFALIFLANFSMLVFGAFRNEHYNQASFRTKREIHLSELTRIFNEVPSVRHDDIALKLFENIFNILQQSRNSIHEVDIHSEIKNDAIGQAFALTFENTAVLCDLILRFPDVYHSHFDRMNNITTLLKWSFELLRQSQLMSTNDENILYLTEQELNFIPKDPNYVNEYNSHQKTFKERLASERKAKKLTGKRVKKPRLTPIRSEL